MREHLTVENIQKAVVGLRPYRRGGLRLETEELGQKLWIHNYGHGGSGITLCWGCADWVVRQLKAESDIAVLGAGAIGLTAATLLLRKGHKVTVYARDFPPHTTSDVAGGLWAPTHVAISDEGLRRDLLRWSWEAFKVCEGDEFGVHPIPLYQGLNSPNPLDPLPAWLIGEGVEIDRLPFGPNASNGIVWQTYLIQTSKFLARLVEVIQESGGSLAQREFTSLEEVDNLKQKVVVNCLGLGAGSLLEDEKMLPIRGQLLYLNPVGRRLALDHPGGYVISRDDALILGGTFEEGVADLEPCEDTSKKILEGNQSFDWD